MPEAVVLLALRGRRRSGHAAAFAQEHVGGGEGCILVMGESGHKCLLGVKIGRLAHASITSVVGGKADEIGGKADIAILNVRCWGVSRRSDGMAQTSAFSQQRTFVGALEVQNQAIGWLRKGCSSLGVRTVVRFPRIWVVSGKCRLGGRGAHPGQKLDLPDPARPRLTGRNSAEAPAPGVNKAEYDNGERRHP